jgi:hypothetical protein
VVEKSSRDALAAFVHSKGLRTLSEWLGAADEGNEASCRLGRKVLAALGKLPIDVEALSESGVGRSGLHEACPRYE